MTKIISSGNCWQSFISCLTDIPLNQLNHCSTDNDDWHDKTDDTLAYLGLFFVEVNPGLVSQLPHGALVGAHIPTIKRDHIVIAEVIRDGPRHGFKVAHDPSGKRKQGTPIEPQRIVLICRLDK